VTSIHAGPWSRARRRLLRDRRAIFAAVTIVLVCVIAIGASWLAPHDPVAQPDIVRMHSQPPSLAHPFGTDPFSRDVLSRVMHGARVSLTVGILSMLIAATLGTVYGAAAGLAGPVVDAALMRVVDAALSVPRLLMLIAVLSLWGRLDVTALILLLGVTSWFGTSRLVRMQVRAIRERDFVQSARALGARRLEIVWRHILPNALSVIVVAATLGIGNVIILEAGLSYLGIGIAQPTASWGNIIQDGSDQIAAHWWISVFPGLAMLLTVLAFNSLGDALRDALDPRLD
jgi:peptide/nickel transport system permease protein